MLHHYAEQLYSMYSPYRERAIFSRAIFLPSIDLQQLGQPLDCSFSRQPSQIAWPSTHCQILMGGFISCRTTEVCNQVNILTSKQIGHSNSVFQRAWSLLASSQARSVSSIFFSSLHSLLRAYIWSSCSFLEVQIFHQSVSLISCIPATYPSLSLQLLVQIPTSSQAFAAHHFSSPGSTIEVAEYYY